MGTLGDFVEFVRTARDRGIRVIADFVMNHTSDQHPWFQVARVEPRLAVPRFLRLARREARREAGRRRLPRPGGLEPGLDKKAPKWYLHRFHSHQPDLNMANPAFATRWHR